MQSSSQNLMAFPKKNDVPNHSIFPSFTRIPPVVKNRGVATPHLAHSGWPHIRSIYNYLHLLLNKYRNACIYIYVYTYMHTYIYIYIYVHTYMYIYICIHMYIYIHTYPCVCLNLEITLCWTFANRIVQESHHSPAPFQSSTSMSLRRHPHPDS